MFGPRSRRFVHMILRFAFISAKSLFSSLQMYEKFLLDVFSANFIEDLSWRKSRKVLNKLLGGITSAKAADASARIIHRLFEYIVLILYDWICRLWAILLLCMQNSHVLAWMEYWEFWRLLSYYSRVFCLLVLVIPSFWMLDIETQVVAFFRAVIWAGAS